MKDDVLISARRALELDTTFRPSFEVEPGRRRLPFSGWHFFLLPLALVMMFPLVWMVATSIETPAVAGRFPPVLIPHTFDWHNYPNAFRTAPFGRWFLNTTVVTLTIVFFDLVLASLAGYAFARLRFFGKEVLFIVFLATLMVPFQVTMIPTFLIVRTLHLVDTLGGLIVPNLGSVFGIFMLRQFFRTLPVELEEAARIDGASRLGVLFKIVLPLSIPALVTLALIDFLWYWNDFLWPLIVIRSPQSMTLQLGLSTFQGAHSTDWTLLMAGTVMSQIPMLVLFFGAQRYFVRSIAFSGLK
jgi:multiple sugar transport system permease protein